MNRTLHGSVKLMMPRLGSDGENSWPNSFGQERTHTADPNQEWFGWLDARRGLSFGRAHPHTADPKVTPAPPSALYLRPYCIYAQL